MRAHYPILIQLLHSVQQLPRSYLSGLERESFMNSLEFLESEAPARSVAFMRFSSPQDAAQHLAKRVGHVA